jgi:hypothetical protein
MADFELVPTIGLDLQVWIDPAFGSTPTRINPLASQPHRYWRALDTNVTIEVRAVIGGVAGPADATLGGRLFLWHFAEGGTKMGFPVPIINPPGFTSIAQLILTPFGGSPGQQVLVASRSLGGNVGLPFIVEMFA